MSDLPDMTDEAIALDDLPDATKHARFIRSVSKLTRRRRKRLLRGAREIVRQETLRRLANGGFVKREQHDTPVMKERLPKLADSYMRSSRGRADLEGRPHIRPFRLLNLLRWGVS